jgi:hypothetical protein
MLAGLINDLSVPAVDDGGDVFGGDAVQVQMDRTQLLDRALRLRAQRRRLERCGGDPVAVSWPLWLTRNATRARPPAAVTAARTTATIRSRCSSAATAAATAGPSSAAATMMRTTLSVSAVRYPHGCPPGDSGPLRAARRGS